MWFLNIEISLFTFLVLTDWFVFNSNSLFALLIYHDYFSFYLPLFFAFPWNDGFISFLPLSLWFGIHIYFLKFLLIYQFSSVTQSCPTLSDLRDCSTPGFPVHHQLLDLAQTHIHRVGGAIQPSHPLSPASPPDFNFFPASGAFPMSQLFASGGQGIGVSDSASVLPVNIQDWIPLELTSSSSLLSQGLSRVFPHMTVQLLLMYSCFIMLW